MTLRRTVTPKPEGLKRPAPPPPPPAKKAPIARHETAHEILDAEAGPDAPLSSREIARAIVQTAHRSMNRVYVLGKFNGEGDPPAWELQGVYLELKDAIIAAIAHDYFVMTVEPDVVLPGETIDRPVWYPARQAIPEGFF